MYRNYVLFVLFAFFLLPSCQQEPGPSETNAPRSFNPELAAELDRLYQLDQVAAYIPQGKYANWPVERWKTFKDSVFAAHRDRMEEIFVENGYPGYDLVGEEGEGNFWVMVQHADHDPAFQSVILAAMKKEVDQQNADPRNYGLLTDRVLLNTGKKQRYGTQVMYNNEICQAMPRPLEDSLQVNERRADLGFEPIEVYLNQMVRAHYQMNKAMFQEKGVEGPVLYPTGQEMQKN
jgi:hypothetical protein